MWVFRPLVMSRADMISLLSRTEKHTQGNDLTLQDGQHGFAYHGSPM